jgi:hypothetical protein
MPKHAIAAGAVAALCAGPAVADLDARGLWADWQATYGAMGAALTAEDETYANGRLTLDGLTTTSTLAGAESRTTYGSIALVERADGTVAIEIPETLTLTTETTVEGETITQTIVVETSGWSGVAREDGDARVYDLDAASMLYRFEDLGEEVPVTATVGLTGMAADYRTTETGGDMTFVQTLVADALTIGAQGSGEEPFDLLTRMTGIRSEGEGSLDASAAAATPTLAQLGLVFDGEATHSGSTTTLSGTGQTGPFTFEGTSQGGRIGFDIGTDALSYDIASTGAEMALQLGVFPLPLNASLAEVSTGITLPVGVSSDPKPLGLSVTLRDLKLDDQIWALFDPTGQLPRDPATVVLALDGTALMRADMFDPEAMAGMTAPPGELRSLDLTELLVSVAGAELTGEGSVTFPNPGMVPQPVGAVTLTLDGGFALLDRLVALGFVPAQQAAFVRGMAGTVAETVGEDKLRSVIEFAEGGGITANGMPLR